MTEEQKEQMRNPKQEPLPAPTRKRKQDAVLRAVGCALIALVFFFIGWISRWYSLGGKTRSLLWAIKTAQNNFYQEIGEDEMYDRLFSAFELDPYSAYYTKEQYALIASSQGGEGADTGMAISSQEEKLRVFLVQGNSPAERAGVLPGMYIHRMGEDASTLHEGGMSELQALVNAHPDGFSIECGYDKEGVGAQVYTLSSEEYYVADCLYRDNEIAVRFLRGEEDPWQAPVGAIAGLPADTAYIRIDQFFGTAASEFRSCLEFMKSRGREHLILDLRCNGGGYLNVFQEISTYLMRNAEEKNPVVTTARYRGGREEIYRATGNSFGAYFGEQAKVYILADENTASASECLIGALVSYGTTDYSEIFLREENGVAKTYGKGIMQSAYPDAQGNVLKLTSAEIFWPNGKSIHGVGVTPEDGAIPITAPLIRGAEDTFLTQVLAHIAG